jgi:hypothetical protein
MAGFQPKPKSGTAVGKTYYLILRSLRTHEVLNETQILNACGWMKNISRNIYKNTNRNANVATECRLLDICIIAIQLMCSELLREDFEASDN